MNEQSGPDVNKISKISEGFSKRKSKIIEWCEQIELYYLITLFTFFLMLPLSFSRKLTPKVSLRKSHSESLIKKEPSWVHLTSWLSAFLFLFHAFPSSYYYILITHFLFLINTHIHWMIKAFQLSLKVGIIPVFSLPHIEPPILAKVESCKKFRDYVEKFNGLEVGASVLKIEILGVEMFGNNVGFVSMRTITEKDGYKLPGYVFLRGHAVAILMFVNQKLLLVEQYRVPVQSTLLEAPAGMIDESGDFVGVAAAEIEEETSIKISKESLKPLGSYFPSPGGCDEEIFLYYCQVSVPEEELKAIEEKIHGKEGESERIKVKLVDYDSDFIAKTKDSKLVYLVYAYENMVKNQKKNSNL